MENNLFERRTLSVNDALTRIHAIKAEVGPMGANDSEFEVLDRIMTELQAGKISPIDAVTQAEGVKGSKMDYH